METFEKIKKSWWVIFPFTFIFPGFGFIYIGLKASNRNWILEGITYELPWFFYLVASAKFTFEAMVGYYVWILLFAAFVALIRSIMVAIKLLDVYEMNEPAATVYSTPSATKSGSNDDGHSNLGTCCACIIFIFIIFAIVSIL